LSRTASKRARQKYTINLDFVWAGLEHSPDKSTKKKIQKNMSKRYFTGFGARVFWSLTLLVVILSVSFTFVFVYLEREFLQEQLISRGQSIARILAIESELGVFTENPYFLEPAIESLSREADLVHVGIFNLEGKSLIGGKTLPIQSMVPDLGQQSLDLHDDIFIRLKESSDPIWQLTEFNGKKIYEFWAQVIALKEIEDEELFLDLPMHEKTSPDTAKNIIGFVKIGLSMEGLEAATWDAVDTSFIILGVFLAVGVGITILLVGRITGPIGRLVHATEAVAKGDLLQRVEFNSGDELGTLADGFNTMVEALKERDDSIALHRKKLEENLEELNGKTIDLELQQEALRQSEERQVRAQEVGRVGTWDWSLDTGLLIWSDEVYRILGLSPREAEPSYKLFIHMVHPEDRISVIRTFAMAQRRYMPFKLDCRIIQNNGFEEVVAVQGELKFNRRGRAERMIGIIHDITERKRAETKLRMALDEKVVLLKEVHHRVKNNLQIISSMLNLQSDYIEDERLKEIFRESQDRIRTMTLIHEKLYQSSNLSSISFPEYTDVLTSMIFRTYRRTNVKLKLDISDLRLDIDDCISLGLIMNELCTNALKHAFPETKGGRIKISLSQDKNGMYQFIVSDNGVGLRSDFDLEKVSSMGLQLVDSMVTQLDGKITVDGKNGATFKITFPPSSNES